MTESVVIEPTVIRERREVPLQRYGMTVDQMVAEMIKELIPGLEAQAKRAGVTMPGKPTYRLTIEVEQAGYKRPPLAELPPRDVSDERWEREVEHAGGKQPLAIAWTGSEAVRG